MDYLEKAQELKTLVDLSLELWSWGPKCEESVQEVADVKEQLKVKTKVAVAWQ